MVGVCVGGSHRGEGVGRGVGRDTGLGLGRDRVGGTVDGVGAAGRGAGLAFAVGTRVGRGVGLRTLAGRLGRGSMVGAVTTEKLFREGWTVGKEEGTPGLVPQ